MPMTWRFVRGRMLQEGRVALMRGPVLFSFSEKLNADVLKKCPEPRDLVLDPASIGDPILDDSVRPKGQKVVVKAWTNPACTGDRVDVVLTEFVDPDGIEVYFKVPNLNETQPIRVVDDELFSEPRRSANGEITMAWYGPKSDSGWKDLLAVKGELVADLAADYLNPQGKQNVPAVFPDKSKSGSWSLFNCSARTDAGREGVRQDTTELRVQGERLPPGVRIWTGEWREPGVLRRLPACAEHGSKLAIEFFARHVRPGHSGRSAKTVPDYASDRQCRKLQPDPLDSRLAAVRQEHWHFRNTVHQPRRQRCFTQLVNWKDENTPVALDVLYLKQGQKGAGAIETEFVVHINPGELGKQVDMAIGNNGSYICDATALRLRVYGADEQYKTPGVDVTKKVQSVFQGKYRTDLGKYTELFGDPAPGQEKTLKLRVQDWAVTQGTSSCPKMCPLSCHDVANRACRDRIVQSVFITVTRTGKSHVSTIDLGVALQCLAALAEYAHRGISSG